ncbi:TIM barrel protein, partial [Streptomyces sp. NPDC005921]
VNEERRLEYRFLDPCREPADTQEIDVIQQESRLRGIHQHLEFGAGEVDFPPVLAELRALGHRGLVSVEIQGGALDAPEVARRSIEFLRAAVA